MTAREAIKKGIRLVRLPNWNEWAYMELPPLLEDGFYGPWAMIYDPISASVLQDQDPNAEFARFPAPLLFTVWDDDDDRLVEFTGARLTPDDIRANRHIHA